MKQYDAIWINAFLMTCEPQNRWINPGAIAVKDRKIAWLGNMQELGASPEELAQKVYDAKGAVLTPSLIDCHTHVIYAGNRAHEFEFRLKGVSYEEIASQGGGIQATVMATRAASEEELLNQTLPRVKAFLANGVSTFEVKSGYGLDLANELKMLKVAKQLEALLPVTIRKTFLGAHTVPLEYLGRLDDYIEAVCTEMIPTVGQEKLAGAVDVFCERIAFDLAQTERVFKTAKKFNLAIKCHSEQLSNIGSAQLAAKYGAISVDHLEHLSEAGVAALANAGSVAVLLPGAYYCLRETKIPPIDSLRKNHVPMALATDCNPGTSPVLSILLILNMACTLFRLTVDEAFQGVTLHAAKALGLQDSHGSLQVGKVADFAIWDVGHPTDLIYYLGGQPLKTLIKAGEVIRF